MKKRLMMALIALTTVAYSATARTQRVRFTTTPQMHCESCEKKIKGNLRFQRGIKNITTNVDSQTVVIIFDPAKTNPTRLIKGFEKIGYKARILKAGEKVVKDNSKATCGNM